MPSVKPWFIIVTIFSALEANAQNIRLGVYEKLNDSFDFSSIKIKKDNLFTYYERGSSLHFWQEINGQWQQRNDTLILIDEEQTEDVTIEMDTIGNFERGKFNILFVNEHNFPLPNVKIAYTSFLGFEFANFISDKYGNIEVVDTFQKIEKVDSFDLSSLRYISVDRANLHYKVFVNNHFIIEKNKYNLVLKIHSTPQIFKLKRKTLFIITNDKLLFVDQQFSSPKSMTKQIGSYWGDFILRKKSIK